MTELETGYKQWREDRVELRRVGNDCLALGAIWVVFPFNIPFCPSAFCSSAGVLCVAFLFLSPKQEVKQPHQAAFIDYSAKRQQHAGMSRAVNKRGSGQGNFLSEGKQNRGLSRNVGCLSGMCHSSKPDPPVRDLHRSLEVTHCEIL